MATAVRETKPIDSITDDAAKALGDHLRQFPAEKQAKLLRKLDAQLATAKSRASASKAG